MKECESGNFNVINTITKAPININIRRFICTIGIRSPVLLIDDKNVKEGSLKV